MVRDKIRRLKYRQKILLVTVEIVISKMILAGPLVSQILSILFFNNQSFSNIFVMLHKLNTAVGIKFILVNIRLLTGRLCLLITVSAILS